MELERDHLTPEELRLLELQKLALRELFTEETKNAFATIGKHFVQTVFVVIGMILVGIAVYKGWIPLDPNR